jgi:TRAP-type C4-dicarboxylate transport system substrate-binding protein
MKLFWITALGAVLMNHVPASQAQVTWKLATGYRAESFHGRNLAEFAQDVAQASKGALKVELQPNNSVVKLNDIRAAVEGGKIEAGETIMSSLVKEMPLAGADSVPFVVSSYADAKRLWTLQRPLIEKTFAKRGLKVLYAVPWPPQGLYSKKPIAGTQDFKGGKMRTYNQTTLRIAEMLGASGVDVPMVDVGKALAEGRMDSMITSAVTGVENKVWSDIRYYYEINAWFPKNIIFVNSKAFGALTTSVQRSVLDAALSAEARGWAMSEKAALDSTAELKANGIKIDRVPRDVEANLKRMGEKFSREWVTSVGNEANDVFIPYYFQNNSK